MAQEYATDTESMKTSALTAKSIFSQVLVSASINPFATGKEAAASLNPFSNTTAKDLNPFNT